MRAVGLHPGRSGTEWFRRLHPGTTACDLGELIGSAVEHDAPFVEHDDAVADDRVVDVMRRDDDAGVAPPARHDVAQSASFVGVEARRRFVEHQQARATQQRLRQTEPSAHATRQVAHTIGGSVEQPDGVQRLDHQRSTTRRVIVFAKHGQIVDDVSDGRRRVEPGFLGQVAETSSRLDAIGLVTRVETVEREMSLVGRRHRGQTAEQRRLAGAVRAEHRHDATAHPEVDVIDDDPSAGTTDQLIGHDRHRRHDAAAHTARSNRSRRRTSTTAAATATTTASS